MRKLRLHVIRDSVILAPFYIHAHRDSLRIFIRIIADAL